MNLSNSGREVGLRRGWAAAKILSLSTGARRNRAYPSARLMNVVLTTRNHEVG